MINDDAAMVAIGHADKTHAKLPCSLNGFLNGQVACWKSQALLGVYQYGSTLVSGHRGNGLAIRAAVAQMGSVLRHPTQPMRGKALGFGKNKCLGSAVGHRFAGTRFSQGSRNQFSCCVDR